MRQSDADYYSILSAIAEFMANNEGPHYNTQKVAGYIRHALGADKLPPKNSGRLFEYLYSKGIFRKAFPGRRKCYFVEISKKKLQEHMEVLRDMSSLDPIGEAKKAVKQEISVSYTLGGESVSDEFYKKFSSRFTEEEKGASYTFRGSSIPEGLNALVESVLAGD